MKQLKRGDVFKLGRTNWRVTSVVTPPKAKTIQYHTTKCDGEGKNIKWQHRLPESVVLSPDFEYIGYFPTNYGDKKKPLSLAEKQRRILVLKNKIRELQAELDLLEFQVITGQ